MRRLVQRLGPYLLLELILPGGTAVAMLLFLYQNRKAIGSADKKRIKGAEHEASLDREGEVGWAIPEPHRNLRW